MVVEEEDDGKGGGGGGNIWVIFRAFRLFLLPSGACCVWLSLYFSCARFFVIALPTPLTK